MLNKQKALYAALSGIAGLAASAAQAAIPGDDGTGSVLQYPYYTVNGGHDTFMSIVNSTASTKAVKVRFLDGKNTREVLDFNLFLSPFDVWTAALVKSAAGGVTLKTSDTSCTTPQIPSAGVDFRTFRFTERDLDGVIIDNSIGRTTEGHIEVIEMGVVTNVDMIAATTHVNGVPGTSSTRNCAWLQSIYNGNTSINVPFNTALTAPTGGLFGGAGIVNVAAGTGYGYNAESINAVFSSPIFTVPGSIFPNLSQADPTASFFQGNSVFTANYASGIDAVSVLSQASALLNEWVTDPSIGAGTDAVITFPTKWAYTPACGFVASAPFVNNGFCPNGAPEVISVQAYDREERTSFANIDFSPLPASGSTSLPWEVNVVTIDNSNVLGSSLKNNIKPPVGNSGWFKVSFNNSVNRVITSLPGATRNGTACGILTARGLPVQGFVAQKYVNGNVGGVLSNYGANFSHRYERSVACL
jgi:hypothetical protein